MERHLYEEEAETLIKILKKKDPFIALFCEILYLTGRRTGELLNLKKRSIRKINENEVQLNFYALKKRRRSRRGNPVFNLAPVIISRKKFDYWNSILKIYGAKEKRDYFFSRDIKKRENDITIRQRYTRLLEKLHYENDLVRDVYTRPNLLFHIWRHSYAWRLKNEKGKSLEFICDALLHDDIKTTKKYYGHWYFDPRGRFIDVEII